MVESDGIEASPISVETQFDEAKSARFLGEHDGEDESPTSQNHVVVLPEATLVAKLMRRLSSKVSPTSNESPLVGTDRLCVGS